MARRAPARSPTPPPGSRPRPPTADAPPPLKPLPVVPPVPFTPEQAARLGALAAVALLANFCGALLSQNGDAVTSAFGRSDQALGVALAVARAGVLVSLVAIALADRWGRRRLILVGAGRRVRGQPRSPRSSPTFEVFTGAQLFSRALVQHRAHRRRHRRGRGRPRGRARVRDRHVRARARRRASGSRWCCSRSPTSATTAGASRSRSAPRWCSWCRSSPGTSRRRSATCGSPTVRSAAAGASASCSTRAYGYRFLLLGLAAFLTNVFSAPSSQLTEPLPHARARLHELRRRAVPRR